MPQFIRSGRHEQTHTGIHAVGHVNRKWTQVWHLTIPMASIDELCTYFKLSRRNTYCTVNCYAFFYVYLPFNKLSLSLLPSHLSIIYSQLHLSTFPSCPTVKTFHSTTTTHKLMQILIPAALSAVPPIFTPPSHFPPPTSTSHSHLHTSLPPPQPSLTSTPPSHSRNSP